MSPATQLELITEFDRVIGLGVDEFQRAALAAPDEALVRERDAARRRRDWATSVRIRDELLEHGIQLMDTSDGTEWYIVPK